MDISNNAVGVWEIDVATQAPAPAAESFFSLDSGTESVFDPDLRVKVTSGDFQDGGKYRSIVKLMIRYQNQRPEDPAWGMGSGWLIRPDLLVTAGHCAYDWREPLGPAVIIKAYIGYSGKASICSNSVQLRMGKKAITTVGWLKSGGENRTTDVAFVQLDQPFTGNLGTFSFEDTPIKGSEILGVVGYPADKYLGEERGAQMYEQFSSTEFDVGKSKHHMLEYMISTFAGQSGSPVLRQTDRLVSVGAHVYGGGRTNSASTIGGTYGNDYGSLISEFDRPGQTFANIGGINIVKPPAAFNGTSINGTSVNGTSVNGASVNGTSVNGTSVNGNSGNDAEGFLDILSSVGKLVLPIASTALSTTSPFLGLLGGPAAALGSVALGALGNMCESSMDNIAGSIRPIRTPSAIALSGLAQRAVLCEAALQAVMRLDYDTLEARQILREMETSYWTFEPALKVAPKLLPALIEPALRIAVSDLNKPKGEAEAALPTRRPLRDAEITESSMDFNQQSFSQALLSPALVVQSEEGFFDGLGTFIKTGLKFTAPLIKTAAQFGVEKLGDILSNTAESEFDLVPKIDALSDALFKRAIMGEAALQAVMKLEPSQLSALPTFEENGQPAQEGFFDFFKRTIQEIGRKVMETAPSVIQAVGPIGLNLLQSAAIRDLSLSETTTSASIEPARPLRRGRSIVSLANARAAESAVAPPPLPVKSLQVSALSTTGNLLPAHEAAQPAAGIHRVDSNLDGLFFASP